MKKTNKIILIIMLIFAISASTVSNVDAIVNVTIKEQPNIKLVINGVQIKLTDPVITKGNQKYIPIIPLLTSMGITNDKKHIMFSTKNKTLKAIGTGINLYIKAEDNKITLNGKIIKTIIPSLVYKASKFYVPFNFSETLCNQTTNENLDQQNINNKVLSLKKVIWDANGSVVYIRDKTKYDEMATLLDSIETSQKQRNKIIINTTMKIDTTVKTKTSTSKVAMVISADKEQGIMKHEMDIPIYGKLFKFLYFYVDSARYTKSLSGNEWSKTEISPTQYENTLEQNTNIFDACQPYLLAAALTPQPTTPQSKELILKGIVCPKDFSTILSTSAGIKNITPQSFQVAYTINKQTYLPVKSEIIMVASIAAKTGKSIMKSTVKSAYVEPKENFQIEIPKELPQPTPSATPTPSPSPEPTTEPTPEPTTETETTQSPQPIESPIPTTSPQPVTTPSL